MDLSITGFTLSDTAVFHNPTTAVRPWLSARPEPSLSPSTPRLPPRRRTQPPLRCLWRAMPTPRRLRAGSAARPRRTCSRAYGPSMATRRFRTSRTPVVPARPARIRRRRRLRHRDRQHRRLCGPGLRAVQRGRVHQSRCRGRDLLGCRNLVPCRACDLRQLYLNCQR